MNRLMTYMRDKKRRILTIILFAMTAAISYAQVKYEKESRIKLDAVPEDARQFIDTLDLPKKIKWYREEGIKQTSYEAKTRINGRLYSIEFSRNGIIEDIEIIVKWKSLPNKIRSAIKKRLTNDYQKIHLHKLQTQYTGPAKSLSQFLAHPDKTDGLALKYELIIHTKINQKYERYECLFSHTGILIECKRIIQKTIDNLEF